MTPTILKSLDNFDFATPGLIEFVHSMVAAEIVHFENVAYVSGGWPQQVIGLQV